MNMIKTIKYDGFYSKTLNIGKFSITRYVFDDGCTLLQFCFRRAPTKSLIKSFITSRAGQGLCEYLILVALISVGLFATLQALGLVK